MHRCSPHTYMSRVILPTSSILLHIFVPPFHAVHPKAIAHPLLPVSIINCPSLLPHLCTLSCIHSKISVFTQLPLYIQLIPGWHCHPSYHAFYCQTIPQCRRLHWQHRQAPWLLFSGPVYPSPSKAAAASLEFCGWACCFSTLMAYSLLWKLSSCALFKINRCYGNLLASVI